MSKPGERVGAILSIADGTVNFLGYGVYEGDFEYPGVRLKNPRIKLDSGDIAWGMECWWGPEEAVKEKIKDRPVIMHRIVRDETGAYIDVAVVQ